MTKPAAMRILAEKLRDRTVEDGEVEVDGTTWYVRKAPRPGVEMSISMGSADAAPMLARFTPVPARPDGYPDDVPFIPDLPATVTRNPETSSTQMVVWVPVADGSRLAADIEAMSLAEGWRVVDRLDAFGTVGVELERDGSMRIVSSGGVGGQQMVTLAQGSGKGKRR